MTAKCSTPYPRLILLMAGIGLVALLGSGCASGDLGYSHSEMNAFNARPNAVQLNFLTDKGLQVAYYLAPKQGVATAPKPLVISFPGIGSRALDRLHWVDDWKQDQAGYLLIDYPGRGLCEGSMRPKHLPQSFEGATKELANKTGLSRSDLLADVRVVGHSFGTAAALRFASDHEVNRIVLLAPMTTLHKALFRKIGPLAWFNPDGMDNREVIRELIKRKPVPGIVLIHGDKDETIPVKMARQLHDIAPDKVSLHIILNETHVSILTSQSDLVKTVLFGKRGEW